MGNELDLGVARHGFIFDGVEDTPHVAAQLMRSSDGIELQIPWLRGHNPQHREWFAESERHLVPDRLEFRDVYGPIALIGCAPIASGENFLAGVGQGRIRVRFAVLGALSADALETINGMRSEIEGLGSWVGLRSLGRSHHRSDEGRIIGIDLKLEASRPKKVPGLPNTELRPSFSEGPGAHPDERLITERMYVQTTTRSAMSWRSHLDRHFALRDLVRIAAWSPLKFVGHEAMSGSEPLLTLDGTNLGANWLPVETALTDKADARSAPPPRFLFDFRQTTLAGIGRWMNIHAEEERIVRPILHLLDLEGASLTTHMAQVATGLEALGYRQALLDGRGGNAAGRERLAVKIERVVDSLKTTIPDEIRKSPQEIADAYNSVKHPDRTLPERLELEQAYLKGLQLFRIWVAELVGVRPKVLAQMIGQDPITHAIAARVP